MTAPTELYLEPLRPATVAEQLAFEAAIQFLMVGRDGPRYLRALSEHLPGEETPCLWRCKTWPCLTYRLAFAARERHIATFADRP